MEERAKLVFLVEARPNEPEKLRVGQPVSVTLGAARGARNGDARAPDIAIDVARPDQDPSAAAWWCAICRCR